MATELWITGDPDTDRLLSEDPFALLVGMLLDQQFPVEHAFAGPGDDRRSWTELLFLSFTTLSSTGLSDIVPTSGHARSVNMIEQVAGLFYIAMVVTRLVSLNRRRHTT